MTLMDECWAHREEKHGGGRWECDRTEVTALWLLHSATPHADDRWDHQPFFDRTATFPICGSRPSTAATAASLPSPGDCGVAACFKKSFTISMSPRWVSPRVSAMRSIHIYLPASSPLWWASCNVPAC